MTHVIGNPDHADDLTQEAIEIIEECKEIHVKWETHVQGVAAPEGPVGNSQHHRHWIEQYDIVLTALRRKLA